jgi:hypothetical protein
MVQHWDGVGVATVIKCTNINVLQTSDSIFLAFSW